MGRQRLATARTRRARLGGRLISGELGGRLTSLVLGFGFLEVTDQELELVDPRSSFPRSGRNGPASSTPGASATSRCAASWHRSRHRAPRAHVLGRERILQRVAKVRRASGSEGRQAVADGMAPSTRTQRRGDKKIAGSGVIITAPCGRAGSAGATVRRQSIASSNSASWAGVRIRAPSTIGGQTNRPAPAAWRTGTIPCRHSRGSCSSKIVGTVRFIMPSLGQIPGSRTRLSY